MDAIWPLVVGFLLTSVLGGLLGTYLQRRSWEHQNEVQLRAAELDTAGQVCQAVSGLLNPQPMQGAAVGWSGSSGNKAHSATASADDAASK